MAVLLFGGISIAILTPARPLYRIGRGPDNDVILVRPTVSRAHASIRFLSTSGSWAVANLSQRNPTLVNGVPAGERWALRDGDRMLVGECELRFKATAQSLPSSDETQVVAISATQARELAAGKAPIEMSGTVGDDPIGVLAMLSNSGKTGRIDLMSSTATVHLWFRNGNLQAASCGNETGNDAFFQLAEHHFTRFTFQMSDPGRVDVTMSTPAALMGLAKRVDDARRG